MIYFMSFILELRFRVLLYLFYTVLLFNYSRASWKHGQGYPLPFERVHHGLLIHFLNAPFSKNTGCQDDLFLCRVSKSLHEKIILIHTREIVDPESDPLVGWTNGSMRRSQISGHVTVAHWRYFLGFQPIEIYEIQWWNNQIIGAYTVVEILVNIFAIIFACGCVIMKSWSHNQSINEHKISSKLKFKSSKNFLELFEVARRIFQSIWCPFY